VAGRDQPLQRKLPPGGRAQRVTTPLVSEGRLRPAPSLALLSNHVLKRNTDVGEKDFAELRVLGDLLERSDLNAGLVHVDNEVGDALVLRRLRIGPRQQDAEIRCQPAAGPDLLTVDHVDVGIANGRGAQ
jgi:hypothetical protein